RHLRLPLPRPRKSNDPRSRPSLFLLGRPHSHAPRRHSQRTSCTAPLRPLFLFPRSNLRLHLFHLLVLRKFSLHRHLHERRPRRSPSPNQRRHRRLDPPLRPVAPTTIRSENRPIHPHPRLARYVRHSPLASPPNLSRLPTHPPPPLALVDAGLACPESNRRAPPSWFTLALVAQPFLFTLRFEGAVLLGYACFCGARFPWCVFCTPDGFAGRVARSFLKNCHPERIRQGPSLGLRWFLPEMRLPAVGRRRTSTSNPLPTSIE